MTDRSAFLIVAVEAQRNDALTQHAIAIADRELLREQLIAVTAERDALQSKLSPPAPSTLSGDQPKE